MNRDQLKERITNNLYDAGQVNFTSDTLNDSIQDGYDEVALLTQCIEKIATVTFVDQLTYYNLATLISDYYRVIAIWNNNTNRWLEPIAYGELDEFGTRWETHNGEPSHFAMLGWEYLALYRKPSTATGTMLVFYKAQADTLAGASTPVIPVGEADVLETYATQDLLDQHLEYQKSQIYWTKYQDQVKEILRDVNKRSLPDRLYMLANVVGKY
jgi:hypothetical protein